VQPDTRGYANAEPQYMPPAFVRQVWHRHLAAKEPYPQHDSRQAKRVTEVKRFVLPARVKQHLGPPLNRQRDDIHRAPAEADSDDQRPLPAAAVNQASAWAAKATRPHGLSLLSRNDYYLLNSLNIFYNKLRLLTINVSIKSPRCFGGERGVRFLF